MDHPAPTKPAGRTALLLAAVPFGLLLLYILVPAATIGFVSDDFTHLVEDAPRPWFDSSDHLNRPLRNGLFRALSAAFDLNPLPYRMLAFVFYAVTIFLLFHFLRRLEFKQGSALTATVLFAFFPKNYEDLFWFGAFQDLVVASCILFACITWLSYLRTGNFRSFFASHMAYVAALGFKETSVGLPLVLFCLELFILRGKAVINWRRFRKYLGFLVLTAVFVGYVFSVGSASSSFHTSRGIYVKTSLLGIIPPIIRTLANIILQFSPPVALRDLTPFRIAIIILGLALMLWAARAAGRRDIFLLSIFWFLVFALPTAVFARSVNADRYLMLPYIGVLFIIAAAVDRFYPFGFPRSALLWTALLAYALAGSVRLVHFRELFSASASEIDQVSSEALRLIKPASLMPNAEVVLANLTHSREVYVFNNGVRGALIEKGLPRETRVVYNFRQPDTKQESMIQAFQSCKQDTPPSRTIAILVFSSGHLTEISGTCAVAVFEADRRNRPDAWIENPESKGGLTTVRSLLVSSSLWTLQ